MVNLLPDKNEQCSNGKNQQQKGAYKVFSLSGERKNAKETKTIARPKRVKHHHIEVEF